MNRRIFIRTTALATGALFLPPALLCAAPSSSNPDVVIIGGGFAGLAAAWYLRQHGRSVVVLESRNRIGGRVLSHQVNSDLTVELGGEWVGQSHTRIQTLCDQLGLQLLGNQMNTHLLYRGAYFRNGQWAYSPAWNQQWNRILEQYPHLTEADKQALDHYDWWRYLVNNGCDGRDLELRELLDSTDFGESIRQVSAFAALAEYAESSEHNEMDFKIRGGNASLATALQKAIGPEHIRMGQQVIRVAQQATQLETTCADGSRFTSKQVICALPAFSVQQIQWEPRLPEAHRDALNQLQYARIHKHAVHFSRRFWKDEAFDLISDTMPQYFYHATQHQPARTGGVLTAYTVGDKAAVMAHQTDRQRASEICRNLEPHFGSIRPLIRSQVSYDWSSDPYSRGAYALYGPGQWFNLRPVLSQPVGTIHFAGEHLADWQGFMEGAVESGEAAARQILSD